VLDSIKLMKTLGIWVEVTSLVIPGKNDSEEEIRDIARFIKQEAGAETPWHISRFHPSYQMHDIPPTPIGTLQRAREIGLEEGLRYVYTGNVAGDDGESTFCYSCKELLIKRYGFQLLENHIEDTKCRYCGTSIDGIMD
jgi:pyruvate formate lyase activating enzyme